MVAATLAASWPARAQVPGLPAVELADVARGRDGFVVRAEGEPPSGAGWSVSGAGDVNGDGVPDAVIGGRSRIGGRRFSVSTCVVFGKADGATVEFENVDAGRGGFTIRCATQDDGAGYAVAGAGDVNGDGLGDLLVAAPWADPADGRADAGETYLVFGKADTEAVELGDVRAGRGGFAIRGNRGPSSWVAAAGDVNGDGLDDILVGKPQGEPEGRRNAGEGYVVFGKTSAEAVDLEDILEGRGGFVMRGSAENDQAGFSVAGAGDVNGDGLADIVIGAPNANPPARPFDGESYVVFGKADTEAIELAAVRDGGGGFAIRGSAEFESGRKVSGAGDVNGDGFADVIVAYSNANLVRRKLAGESCIVFGKPDGAVVEIAAIQAGRGGFAIHGAAAEDSSGRSVSGVGDMNGDGLADVLIGSPDVTDTPGASPAGASYVVFGKPDGAAVDLADLPSGLGGFAIRGAVERNWNAAFDTGGYVSGAGDVNGDGLADFIFGAPHADPGRRIRAGESYVVFGKSDGDIIQLAAVRAGRGGFAIRGVAGGDSSGRSVSGAGDVDGDGLDDLLVGAPGRRSSAGEGYVVFGKPDGAAVELAEVQDGRGGFAIRGSALRDNFGWSVSGAADINGDGLADIVVGAPGVDRETGESYVIFGKTDGAAVELAEIRDGRGGFAIRGSEEEDFAGWSVSGAGDVNADGLADLLIGAPSMIGSSRIGGESYVVFGKADGTVVELSRVIAGLGGFSIHGNNSGEHVSAPGDVDGDGLADLLLGARTADPEGRENAGESYVVFGKTDGVSVDLDEIRAGRGGFAIRGAAEDDFSGRAHSGAGDVNGDGLADLLINATSASPEGRQYAGETYVVYGQRGGAAVDLASVREGRGGFAIRGVAEDDGSGWSLAGSGDVNGDGHPDFLLASDLADARYPDLSRAIFVAFGPVSEAPTVRFRRGAVRGEEALEISDGIRLLGYLFLREDEPSCLDAADADDSGELNLSDAVWIFRYLFLGGDAPPDPGPATCGEDPTDDDLGCVTPGCPA